jgi:hypothetical protein
MASAAMSIRQQPKRRGKVRLLVIHGGRELASDEGAELLLKVGSRLRARVDRLEQRYANVPERLSVGKAMLAVEEQIVKALWTIARQPLGGFTPIASARCGIEYTHDRTDVHSIYSDAAGGKWDTAAPRPSLPSAKDISAADRVQDWLLLIDDEDLRKLLVIGATSKRGDAGRKVNWIRLRPSVPQYGVATVRTLQRRYDEALRVIVNALTVARIR